MTALALVALPFILPPDLVTEAVGWVLVAVFLTVAWWLGYVTRERP